MNYRDIRVDDKVKIICNDKNNGKFANVVKVLDESYDYPIIVETKKGVYDFYKVEDLQLL